jgi:hypothetical protein
MVVQNPAINYLASRIPNFFSEFRALEFEHCVTMGAKLIFFISNVVIAAI